MPGVVFFITLFLLVFVLTILSCLCARLLTRSVHASVTQCMNACRKRKLEAAAADQTPQDLAEQAAATELAEACAEMDKPYTYAELRDRLKVRMPVKENSAF